MNDLEESIRTIQFEQVRRTMPVILSDPLVDVEGLLLSPPVDANGRLADGRWNERGPGYLRTYQVYRNDSNGTRRTTYCLIFYNEQCEQVFWTVSCPLGSFVMIPRMNVAEHTIYLSCDHKSGDRTTRGPFSFAFQAPNSYFCWLKRWLMDSALMNDAEENKHNSLFLPCLAEVTIKSVHQCPNPLILVTDVMREDHGHRCPHPSETDMFEMMLFEIRHLFGTQH